MNPTIATNERLPVAACPVCDSSGDFQFVREIGPIHVMRCPTCALQFATPQPSDRELGEIYGPDYFLGASDSISVAEISRMKQATAELYLDQLAAQGLRRGARILELGSGHGDFLVTASRRGFDVTGVEYSAHACATTRAKLGAAGTVVEGDITNLGSDVAPFDAAVACDVIEHVRNPASFVREIRARLAPGGLLLIATPSLDSWSARLLGRRWMEYKLEHLTYFSRSTLQRLLERGGFAITAQLGGRKCLNFDYVSAHFERFPVRGVTPFVLGLRRITPRWLRRRNFRIVASGVVMVARTQSQ